MAATYLSVDFSEKATVKALGARWDPQAKKWFVPEGRDLAPFNAWLPAGLNAAAVAVQSNSTELQVTPRGKTLSQLLAGVADAVARAFGKSEWTVVDVVQATIKNHVFMEVAERDANGVVLAKATAMIWANVANEILPRFESATGMSIGPGIKLLVRARPVFNSQHGFRLTIDAIDPDYTLGDLEARKREIRARLKREGLWGGNKALESPWNFNEVIVIAPRDADGLGDFQAEAGRLEGSNICKFSYASSRFQGEAAAHEILQQIRSSLADFEHKHDKYPDVVVLIRGGGAVNDLAWLNDYELAKFVCELKVPVFTGIGHERDSTILDEVAHTSFDTPSKVIAGIETVIARRTREARDAFGEIIATAQRKMSAVRRNTESWRGSIQGGAAHQIYRARGTSSEVMAEVNLLAIRGVSSARERARDLMNVVQRQGTIHVTIATQRTPILLAQVRDLAFGHIQNASTRSEQVLAGVLDSGKVHADRMKRDIDGVLTHLSTDARQRLVRASTGAEALMLEIAGQGPQKTLARGYAHIRDTHGKTIMSAGGLIENDEIKVTFHDGVVPAKVIPKENT